MGSVLHGSPRTTPRARAELRAAQASTQALAAQYGLNPKTVAKWRRRTPTEDAPMGPRERRSTVLTAFEEALVVEFRRRTLLPLDDVLGRLREKMPRLSLPGSCQTRCLSHSRTLQVRTRRAAAGDPRIGGARGAWPDAYRP
jgi:transposase-like protein